MTHADVKDKENYHQQAGPVLDFRKQLSEPSGLVYENHRPGPSSSDIQWYPVIPKPFLNPIEPI